MINPNFHAVALYRLASFIAKWKFMIPFCKIIMYINRIVYSVDIDYRAKLAGGVRIIHGIGIIIGSEVRTEGPITIYQGVTLGGNSQQREKNGTVFKQPWIGKNVSIYAGAKVIGPCLINDNVEIGAGSFVNKDV